MDVVGGLITMVRGIGDEETAHVLEGILADEIQHVRFANRWIKEGGGRAGRNLLKVGGGVRWITPANRGVVSEVPETNRVGTLIPAAQDRIPAVNVEDRRLAEFSDEEIHEILRQAGFRSL